MAHFIYPSGTPLGTVPFGYVVPSGEWQTTIRQVFKAVNGDEGGTWAPSSFITIGGSGIKLTGTGHQIASGGRLNVMSGGELRLANGSIFRAHGASDILIQVIGDVAQMKLQSGTVAEWQAGSALDMYGSFSVKSTGTAAWEDGSNAAFQSGSFLNLNSGAIMNANGQINVYGQTLVMSTGLITVASGGSIIAVSGATMTWGGQLAVTGELIIGGSNNWITLSPDRAIERVAFDLIPLTYNETGGGAMLSPHIFWLPSPTTVAPAATTSASTVSGNKSILRFLNIPVGAVIESVDLVTQGLIDSGADLQVSTYTIVSWANSISAGFTAHSSTLEDAHTPVNWLSAALTTSISASGGGVTVQAGRQYGILMVHPYNLTSLTGVAIAVAEVSVTLSVGEIRY